MNLSNKRARSSNNISSYICDVCNLDCYTSKQLWNHKRIHKKNTSSAFSAGSSTYISLDDEDLLSLIDDNITEDIPFDPFQPRTYKASRNFEAGDEGHVYGDNIFTENIFTTSQLLSIELYDIVTSFNVSTEYNYQLFNLMNMVFQDYDKLSKEYSSEIIQAEPVNTLLKKKTAIKAHIYDICKNVCKLYNNTQCKEECPHCGSKSFLEPTGDAPAPLVSVKTMKMMSLGDQLARLLGNKKSKQQLTIVHVMILNSDPLIRYINKYLIQLAIILGKPVDLDSFLLPIIDEVISLGKYGLIIKKFDGERIVEKVHMVTKYCHHKGHNSRYGCHVCEVLGQVSLRGRGMYFKNYSAPLRPKIDFVNVNTNTNIQEPNIFARLSTFTGSSFYGLHEMHLIGHDIGKLVHKLIIVKIIISYCRVNCVRSIWS
ncbi:C2H2-type zinc finger transcription factor [Phycomyces blakesleeanus NRRL 1555(-)]|uniref:C2H2-type zinc finger transcription factor n=1 Tax=Phycomyces blakesleeanus (strain ATCC 8743b / DSM 1359 / FGSC 10004 / NBRC 33097 / NRRL 1555) TaxID=763407 RepID=A0A162TAM2_PHYB8|nr:C2H2-type zinc finger transcription factor [Phycomyces blakesleeanus NRRL 1555(-)]OAD65553.1 C2H2-type zinc finger transcription factor [Phycomyces blakesleeanus NRRL 1555(-)]|eukprot:XP_018283593.1 C2H2-type zinc finger transcription factor [Phycomyces blakesleeanus NRRL 1555(-)]